MNRRGSALIICLIFVVLISIALVGFVSTTGLERKTTHSQFSRVQAELFAQMGMDQAVASLSEAVDPLSNLWVSGPGRLVTVPVGGGTATVVNLHSGKAATDDNNESVDLNPKSLLESAGILLPDPDVKMRVKWIEVKEGGTGPVIGRYAFWTDDLSARLNLNSIASTTYTGFGGTSHPSHVSLTALPPFTASDETALDNARTNKLFDSVKMATGASNSPTLSQGIKEHDFALTHYNHSPELNLFNEPRIVLTTQRELAGDAPFLDILAADNTDPGIWANIDPTKYQNVFDNLYQKLSRSGWPCAPGKSFKDKYKPEGLAQIVLNIIDHVRSAESDEAIVVPSRGAFNPSTGAFSFQLGASSYGPQGRMGQSRRLQITKMGVWIRDTSPFFFSFRIQVYWPEEAGEPIDLLGNNRTLFIYMRGEGFTKAVSSNLPITAADIQGGPRTMQPGQYRTISKGFQLDGAAPNNYLVTPIARPPGPLYIRTALRMSDEDTQSMDIAPTMADTAAIIEYPLDPPGSNPTNANITAICVDDSYINQSRFDWAILEPGGLNKFGPPPDSSLGKSPTAPSDAPQQDTNAANLTVAGARFPAVKGTANNPYGLVMSVADLGQVHTGGKGTTIAGVPWRTVRLQPTRASDDTLPDWALLDLFTITDKARGLLTATTGMTETDRQREMAGTHPRENSLSGLVNVNAALIGFEDDVSRPQPLQAVFTAAGKSNAATLANNVINQSLATGTNPGKAYMNGISDQAPFYWTAGQIAEVADVASSGEESEALLREIIPHLTAKGQVFAVYAVGQKLKELPNGSLNVVGEARSMTILELVPQYRRDGSGNLIQPLELEDYQIMFRGRTNIGM